VSAWPTKEIKTRIKIKDNYMIDWDSICVPILILGMFLGVLYFVYKQDEDIRKMKIETMRIEASRERTSSPYVNAMGE
jgi:hypothetical protein